jgi:GNAT superfamily N-acetyltransferase
LIALRANLLAGVLLATFNGWHVFVSHLVVAPAARGEGIGKFLIRYCFAKLRPPVPRA